MNRCYTLNPVCPKIYSEWSKYKYSRFSCSYIIILSILSFCQCVPQSEILTHLFICICLSPHHVSVYHNLSYSPIYIYLFLSHPFIYICMRFSCSYICLSYHSVSVYHNMRYSPIYLVVLVYLLINQVCNIIWNTHPIYIVISIFSFCVYVS